MEEISAWSAEQYWPVTTASCSLGKHHWWKKAVRSIQRYSPSRRGTHGRFGRSKGGGQRKNISQYWPVSRFPVLEETCLDCTAVCPLASAGQLSVDGNQDNTVCREKGGKCVTVSSHLHSHCLCGELLGWDCKVIVNVNKVLREN